VRLCAASQEIEDVIGLGERGLPTLAGGGSDNPDGFQSIGTEPV
jgi:hypothetical protein